MPTLTFAQLTQVLTNVAAAFGCPPGEAEIVAESLAKANLAGHDSHGLIRVEQYAAMVKTGEIVPGAPTTVLRETPAMALLDGGWNFGAVVARNAVELGIKKAKEVGTGTISVRNSNHLGRLGEYSLLAAEQGLLCFGTVNNHGRGNLVAPFGGSDGRLSTNPITFASPGVERPIVVDITTSVVAEGKVRLLKNAGRSAPEGWLLDNQGHPTTDPNDLYTNPRGSILPFGGAVAHKGFGLSIMVDLLSGALSGAGCSQSATGRLGNAMYFTVIDPAAFLTPEEYLEHVTVFERYVRASPPASGFSEILFPGEPEFRTEERRRKEGIVIDEETWRQFVACAANWGVAVVL